MKRRLLLIAICGSLLSLAVENPAQASTRFNTCQDLNRRYSNGVAKNRTSVKKTRARVSLSIYNANQHLDLNKNGVACERGEASSAGQGIPAQPAVGSGRGNPFPVGTSALRPDGWEIQVVSAIPDATSQVLAENMFNDPPKPGYQFFIARVRATYRGANSTSFDGSFRLRAVSAAGSTYSTFNDSCGVIPDPISSNRAFNGGTVEGNICWAIPTTAANNLVMYDDSFLSKDSDIRFWALPFAGEVAPPSPVVTTPPPVVPGSAVGSGRGNPFPVGTSALRPDGWEIQVVSAIPDATSQVLAENMFNDPPKPGYQFFIARVRATYRGANSTSFDGSFRLRAVSAAGSTYSTFNDSCGVIPDPISSNRAFNGGTVEGNICWAIPTTAANNLVMYDDSFLSKDSDIRFWALS